MPGLVKIEREYMLVGVVVDRATQRGVRGVRVEAYDKDTRFHDMLGQAVTDGDGAFTIGFDSSFFGDHRDQAPDVFYKVFMDEKQVLTTFDRPQLNLPRGTTRARLEIALPPAPTTGKDRISAQQASKAIDWWQASDFRGVFNQYRDKTKTVGALLASLAGSAVKNFDFKPLQVQGTREKEVVNQRPDSARTALAQQQVQVSEVKPVSTLQNAADAKMLVRYPVRLNPGDKVTLYQENGVVKFYARDPAPAASADTQTVARIDGDVQSLKAQVTGLNDLRTQIDTVKEANADTAARASNEAAQIDAHTQELNALRLQLEQVQQASANKDVLISKLQSDLIEIRQAQDNLANRLPLDRLAVLEQQIDRLSRQPIITPPSVVTPQPVVTPPAVVVPPVVVRPQGAGSQLAEPEGAESSPAPPAPKRPKRKNGKKPKE